MMRKRLLSMLMVATVVVSASPFVGSITANAANEASQFSNINLARTYKKVGDANPCITQKFNADPCAMEYNGRVYVYATNDTNAAVNGGAKNDYGRIKQINVMSSSDMVNWTDHGSINVAGSGGAARWASNSWAPTACHKKINGKEKFFLYFANNASGIGVLTSDSPTGPWVDPIGKPLVTKQTPNCWGVEWMFDPAVLVDSDGTGYLYFGGGVPNGKESHPQTARVIKLGADMISTVGEAKMIDAPYMFEDSGINKVGDTYYYSYCTNWTPGYRDAAKIGYMTSKSPMGPFTYKGICLDNPGVFFGTTGNNHHSMVTLNNKSYILYHTEWLNKQMYGEMKGYRTTHVNEINIGNGYISNAKGDLKGVNQIKNLNPYVSNEAETIAWQGGIDVTNQGNSGNTKVEMNRGDWIGVSNVDFGNGAKSLSMKVASRSGAIIKVCTGSQNGPAVGYITVPATGNNWTFKDVTTSISGLTGTKNLFFVASGDCAIDNWQFSSNGTVPTQPTQPSTTPGETVKLADGWYYIKNINAGKYLSVTGNTGQAGQNVELRTGSGVDGQKWYLKNLNDGYVTLKSALGDFMIDIAYGKDEDGANAGIYNGYSGDAQQFMLKTSSTRNAYVIATKCSNLTKVLDDYEFRKEDGTNVCQWTYGGKGNQQWKFEPVQSGTTNPSNPTTPSNPSNGKLKLDYTINNWGSGYQVNFKISNNTSANVNGWTLKIKKSDINISSSWNVTVNEVGDYYVITPVSWNANIAKGGCVEFGTQGSGHIGNTINYIFA